MCSVNSYVHRSDIITDINSVVFLNQNVNNCILGISRVGFMLGSVLSHALGTNQSPDVARHFTFSWCTTS